jgi:hypothetical protein
MQPTYMPWCGYFNLINSVDHFVFLDDVKLEKSNWHVRNRIKSSNGEVMLTISVNLPNGRTHTMINQAQLDFKKPWQKKHLKSLYTNYKKSEYFDSIYAFIEPLILNEHTSLSTFTIDIIKSIAAKLDINTPFSLASQMPSSEKTKDERLVDICNSLGVNHYLSPLGSAQYLEKHTPGGAIVQHGLLLDYQNFHHPTYPQLYGEFMSHLSIIDMLFNCGFEQTAKLIK